MQKANELLQSAREMATKIMKENFELQSKIRCPKVHDAQQQFVPRPKRHEIFSRQSIDGNNSPKCSTKDCIVMEQNINSRHRKPLETQPKEGKTTSKQVSRSEEAKIGKPKLTT